MTLLKLAQGFQSARLARSVLALMLAGAAGGVAAQSAPATPAAHTTDPVQQMLDRYDAGDYRLVARDGPGVLANRASETRLRLAVANSLSWTGRYVEATAQYQQLLGTDQEAAARIGLGNILRWRGMPDLAAEQFATPGVGTTPNRDLDEARDQLSRELRPSTTFKFAHSDDSDGQKRDDLSVAWRYWTKGNAARIDVSALGGNDERGTIDQRYREGRVSVFLPKLPLSPRIELGTARGAHAMATGYVYLDIVRDVFSVRGGRVDWGRVAFNSLASQDGLTANTYGATLNTELPVARVRARYDTYAISDGNRIDDADLQVTPVWQPIPGGITWHVGGYYHKADRADPRYWSPEDAYGLATFALKRNWFWNDGEIGIGVLRGFKATEGAHNTWAYSLNGRVWLNKDWSLAADAASGDTPRIGGYRYSVFTLSIQKLW